MDLSHNAWITRSRLRSSSAMGRLELADGRLRFSTLRGGAKGGAARWLEELAGRPGVKDQLEAGDPVLLLDAPVEACRITFPRLMFGQGMQIATGGKTWTIWLTDPAGATGFDTLDLFIWFLHRRVTKPWKAALRR